MGNDLLGMDVNSHVIWIVYAVVLLHRQCADRI